MLTCHMLCFSLFISASSSRPKTKKKTPKVIKNKPQERFFLSTQGSRWSIMQICTIGIRENNIMGANVNRISHGCFSWETIATKKTAYFTTLSATGFVMQLKWTIKSPIREMAPTLSNLCHCELVRKSSIRSESHPWYSNDTMSPKHPTEASNSIFLEISSKSVGTNGR